MPSDQQAIRELPPPRYTEEERQRIIQYLMELKGDLIREFLESSELPKSGTKPELRERIEQYLDEGTLKFSDLVNFLDSVAPWGKQHVFLYVGPETDVNNWRDNSYVTRIAKEKHISEHLNARLPLILPKTLTLSSIEYQAGRELSIYAVERREYFERKDEHDERKIVEKQEIELRAYLHQVTRGVISFRWNLVTNNAILQISQLPSGSKYEDVEKRFGDRIRSWLNLELFQKIDLRPVIKKLHELEGTGSPEARSHGIGYRTHGGRSVSAQSSSPRDSLVGEPVVDRALSDIRSQGVGHIGNFYWLPSSVVSNNSNSLQREVHTIIVGNEQRINFATPNEREDIEYVLSRVRALSR
jgi:hypothetical protein